ncbi:LacI family transcriptional regulator [Yinghuangia sp. ASG 101]|uniref:LacI family DNA-binding transcriptional regulator n=1 Tax=Yinghuangia sp. ASG 101 TaxID=2896848 RepID=UPI001E5DD355|nr:LacI family DNA-binding transcriptional regulator [Yinghuangia sp. ASG 101]UGQ15182.1 LacI family transcriptional regulator [Yinghuangia sp. ASG 101]
MTVDQGVPRRRPARVGIRDVAAAAGVSITTVSDALNGKGRLPDSTRLHVREIADRLGYRPSAAARTLRTGRSGLIGLTTTNHAAEPFALTEYGWFTELVRAATGAALDRGYALVVLPTSSRHDVWGNVALDGTIVVDPVEDDPMVRELLRRGVPVVTGGHPGTSVVHGWVDIDHTLAMRTVLDHLAENGGRRVGLLAAENGTYARRSVEAYRAWCAEQGAAPIVEAYPLGGPGAAALAAGRLLDRAPEERPDAVFGLHEGGGAELLAAARARGLRVPDDLLVAGCGEDAPHTSAEPPMTTLSLQPRITGSSAVELLVGVIEDQTARAARHRPTRLTVPIRLSARASTRRRTPGF